MRAVSLPLAAAITASTPLAFAQDLFWDTDTDTPGAQGAVTSPGIWSQLSTNWWNGTTNTEWQLARDAIFGGTPGVVQVELPSEQKFSVNDIFFNSGGFNIPASSFPEAYELKGSVFASRPIEMNPLTSPSDPADIHVAAGVRAIISFTASGSGISGNGFDKFGGGTLYMQANSTTATSTFGRTPKVQAGTLVFDSMEPASLASSNPYPNIGTNSAAPIQVWSGATLIIDRSHALGGSGSTKHIEVISGGALHFANARQQLHSLRIGNASVTNIARHTTSAAADEADVSAILTPDAGTAIVAQIAGSNQALLATNVDVLNGPLTFDVSNGTLETDMRMTGQITATTSATHAVTKTGPGTLDLESENNFGGDLIVDNGILAVKETNALGLATVSGNGEVRVSGSGAIELSGTSHTRNKNWFISGTGPGGQGAIRNNGKNLTTDSRIVNLTLTDVAAIGGNSNYHIGWNPATPGPGAIVGGGHTLIKRGGGQVHIRGASSNIIYEIEAGTLVSTSSSSFPAAVSVRLNGGALRGNQIINTIASPIEVTQSGTLGALTDNTVFSGAISQGNFTLTLDAPVSTTAVFTGGITGVKGGPGPIIKTGLGEVILNCPAPLPTTVVEGILRGTGTLTGASCTVSADASLAPGHLHGTMTINGNLAVQGKLRFEIQGTQAGKLVLNGALQPASGSMLELASGNTYTQPAYILVEYTSLSGAFSSLTPPPSGYIYDFNYQGNNQIALVQGVADPYDTWIAAQGLAGADALRHADPDGDGLANVIEFVLGTQPNPANGGGAGAGNRITFEIASPTHVTFRFARQTVASYLAPVVRYGPDLANANAWPTAVHNSNGVTITTNANHFGAGIDRVNVTIPRDAALRLFARLAVP